MVELTISNDMLSLLTVIIILILAIAIAFFFDMDNVVIILIFYGMLAVFLYLYGVVSFGHGAIGFIVISIVVYVVSRSRNG